MTRTQHEHGGREHDMAHGGGADMSQMMRRHHEQTLWVWWTVVLLGFWMMATPLTFGSGGEAVPAGGRSVPFDLATRAGALWWSDVLSGLLLVAFGWRMLTPGRPYARWAAAFVGIWLQAAPLIFWAPSAAVYLNDTFVGALVIALTILVPGMPAMMAIMKPGPVVPPGWTYNPSSWPQRAIMIALAFAGWLVSRYLTAYQLGYIGQAWDPFFGEGSRRVLESEMSELWPISDAGLGAFAYTLEFLMGWMGGPARWRTMPWMVLFFGILVVPLGLTHIVLVISQPVVVGAWCTMCLLAAAIMLPMIPLALDEVVAMMQLVSARVRQGHSFWTVFWKGDTIEGGGPDERSPAMVDVPQQPVKLTAAATWGVSVPWTLAAATAAGLWLMAAPAAFGTTGAAADSDHLAGALVAVVAVVAMAEVARPARFLNVLLGVWLVVSGWLLGAGVPAAANSTVAGILVAILSLPRGPVREQYGGWQRWIW
ncbi:MAG TPA: vitamin K epoxide reductase family protein [Vicinamibacterales bacterium]|nr:vitamin K epoxide reductase family protein [Vicinamibacterales bacterium]